MKHSVHQKTKNGLILMHINIMKAGRIQLAWINDHTFGSRLPSS